MKGRKPKLRLIEGSAGLGRCPDPPMWLSPHSKGEWRRVAPGLHNDGRLTPGLLATLESYCVAVGAIREAEELMQAEGRMIVGAKGMSRHPAVAMQTMAMREARLLAAELRITREPSPDPGEDKQVGWEPGLLA